MLKDTRKSLEIMSRVVWWLTVFTGLAGISLMILVLTLPLTQETTQLQHCVEQSKL